MGAAGRRTRPPSTPLSDSRVNWPPGTATSVRVNAIAPGLIDTPMVADFSRTEESKATLASYPGKRLGKPEDIAAAAAFLVSDDADYIHAATLPVDGGMVDTFGAHLSVD